MNRTIASHRRYCCFCSLNLSLRLLSPLVFTVTALEISLFKHQNNSIKAFRKFKLAKFSRGWLFRPPPPQLNNPLARSFKVTSLNEKQRAL